MVSNKVNKKSLVVGVTGGVGSGKTVVSRHLKTLGCYVIDADLIARRLIDRKPDIRNQLKQAFGSEILDTFGKLKRKELAKIVFQNASRLEKLNQIIQPHLISEIEDQISTFQKTDRQQIIVVDMAIIFEVKVEHLFDCIVVVKAPEDRRIKWLSKDRGWSISDIQQRIQFQLDIQYKINHADFVLENSGTLNDLKIKTEGLFRNFVSENQ